MTTPYDLVCTCPLIGLTYVTATSWRLRDDTWAVMARKANTFNRSIAQAWGNDPGRPVFWVKAAA